MEEKPNSQTDKFNEPPARSNATTTMSGSRKREEAGEAEARGEAGVRLAAVLPLALLILGCATSNNGYFITPGIPATTCEGIEHPEQNPACPEWVDTRKNKPVEKPE